MHPPPPPVTMYAVLEQNPAARSDCTILSLSWKGTVPESEKDKSYTRKRHYTKGWLATGNVKGVVGATYTTSHTGKSFQAPARRNFNLRGHNSEVFLASVAKVRIKCPCTHRPGFGGPHEPWIFLWRWCGAWLACSAIVFHDHAACVCIK